MQWFVYIIETECGHLYCGITTDLKRRFQQHLNGDGAKFFRGKKPKKIVFKETYFSRSDALKREWKIKKLSRNQKKMLVLKKLSL
jgi:putative endonuclease